MNVFITYAIAYVLITLNRFPIDARRLIIKRPLALQCVQYNAREHYPY